MTPSRDVEGLGRAYSNPHLERANPCPFCGSTTLAIVEGPQARLIRTRTWQILCAGCLCRGPVGGSEAQAVSKWNGEFGPVHRSELDDP